MGKSSDSSSRQSAGQVKSPLHQFAFDPGTLRRAHAAVHRFVEHFDAEVEDAVHAARGRQLAAIRRIEQTGRYLHSRYLVTDQAAGTSPKPQGLIIEPDFVLALKTLDAAPLADCVSGFTTSSSPWNCSTGSVSVASPSGSETREARPRRGRRPILDRQRQDRKRPL